MNISIEQIRDDFDKYYSNRKKAFEKVDELVKDISEHGLKTPITIHKIGNNFYEVVEGVHRLRALKQLGWKEVPCEIVTYGPQLGPHPTETNR